MRIRRSTCESEAYGVKNAYELQEQPGNIRGEGGKVVDLSKSIELDRHLRGLLGAFLTMDECAGICKSKNFPIGPYMMLMESAFVMATYLRLLNQVTLIIPWKLGVSDNELDKTNAFFWEFPVAYEDYSVIGDSRGIVDISFGEDLRIARDVFRTYYDSRGQKNDTHPSLPPAGRTLLISETRDFGWNTPAKTMARRIPWTQIN